VGTPPSLAPIAAHFFLCNPFPSAALSPLLPPPPAALVPHRAAFFVGEALPFLLPLCTDPVLEVRHGAVAAVAELLPALRCVCGWGDSYCSGWVGRQLL